MDFSAFDTKKTDEYSKRAKEQWGKTDEYKEFTERSAGWTDESQKDIMNNFMLIFKEFGQMKEMDPAEEMVQKQVKKLQNYISEHFYTCSNQILASLGQMYDGGGEFTTNINSYGGEGTAEFTAKAIEIFCR